MIFEYRRRLPHIKQGHCYSVTRISTAHTDVPSRSKVDFMQIPLATNSICAENWRDWKWRLPQVDDITLPRWIYSLAMRLSLLEIAKGT